MTLIFRVRDSLILQIKNISSNVSGLARARTRAAILRAIGVFLILSAVACTETVNLQTGLNDADANEILTLLNRSGIESQKHTTKEGVTITVSSSDISRATDVMRAAGLPKRKNITFGEIFKKEGMISTPLEERIRYIHGLSQELEYTLQQFDNVISARVHVVLPERVAPGEPIQPSSAAVFIKHRLPFDEDTILPRVRSLVASSIPGLSGEDARSKVSVVLAPSEIVASPLEWTTVGPFKVQVNSSGSLTTVLVILSFFAFIGIASILGFLVMRNPKIAAKLKGKLASKNGSAKKVQVVNKPKNG